MSIIPKSSCTGDCKGDLTDLHYFDGLANQDETVRLTIGMLKDVQTTARYSHRQCRGERVVGGIDPTTGAVHSLIVTHFNTIKVSFNLLCTIISIVCTVLQVEECHCELDRMDLNQFCNNYCIIFYNIIQYSWLPQQ